jgi:hypothetical protein
MTTKRTWIEVASTAVLATAISLLALLPALKKLGSAWGGGDMLSAYVNIENWGLFGFTTGNRFGYPLGMNQNLFPSIDITQNSFAALIGWITGNPFIGINLLRFLSFPLVAVLAYCSIRLTGLRGPLAIALAVAFTMIPFHFARGLGHISLATMYGAVTAVILAQLVGSGRMKNMLFPHTDTPVKIRITNYSILVALVITTAWSGVYYAAFGLLLMAAAWLWQLATTRADTRPSISIPIRQMHQVHPPEGFFNKSVRLAGEGVNIMGTLRSLYEGGKIIYGGVRAAAPLLAML